MLKFKSFRSALNIMNTIAWRGEIYILISETISEARYYAYLSDDIKIFYVCRNDARCAVYMQNGSFHV